MVPLRRLPKRKGYGMSSHISNAPTPEFLVRPCDCGGRDCQSIIFAMIKPVLRPLEPGSDELGALVHFPMANLQSLVDYVRELAAEKGFEIR